jgi:hypothetical protein
MGKVIEKVLAKITKEGERFMMELCIDVSLPWSAIPLRWSISASLR